MEELTHVEKLKLVREWLHTVYLDEPVPPFSKSPEIIDNLYSTMVAQKRLEQDEKTYIDYQQNCCKEYAADTKNIFAVLHRMKLKPGLFQQSTQERLANLSKLASTLKLADVQESNYLLAMSDLILESEQVHVELDCESNIASKLGAEITNALLTGNKLEKFLTEAEESKAAGTASVDAKTRQTQFLQQKIAKYDADISACEDSLAASGMRSHLTHKNLLANFEKLEEIRASLKEKKEKLSAFENLPPDRDLANVKLEVAKSELQEIESELAKRIDMFHL